MSERSTSIDVPEIGAVSAILDRPADAVRMIALAHGAGADMRHRFMEAVASRLAARRTAVLRYQMPFMERAARAGRRGRPDPAPVLQATVVAAVRRAVVLAGDLPVLAGGKSLGGRMTTAAAAAGTLPPVRGIVLLGFPLHPPKRPGTTRAGHLAAVTIPMLFLQGTRDALAELDLVTEVCGGLGPRATLHVVEGGDHAFEVLKRGGRTADEVLDELADTIVEWARTP